MARVVRGHGVPAIAAAFLCASPMVSSAAQSRIPPPELSGIWGRNSVDFEPPLLGPGPVVNMSRKADGAPDRDKRAGDYTNPILKPDTAAQVKRLGDISRGGGTFPTPTNSCWPQSPPYILWNLEMQMAQHGDRVTIMYMIDHLVRHVRLNRPHPEHVTPSWSGDSVGHYEGDTLVIDTVGITVGPLSPIDEFGTPHSAALHVVERYRLIDGTLAKARAERNEKEFGRAGVEFVDLHYPGKGLEVRFTVEDEGVFTMPWSALVTYRRGSPWVEAACAENPHEYYTGKDTAVPTAKRPDF